MFELTEEMKRKLVKDLSREWYFFDGAVTYRVKNQLFQFMVHSVCIVGSLDSGLNMFISPTMLEMHGVDAETFFNDVKECYKADGIDILSEKYKS